MSVVVSFSLVPLLGAVGFFFVVVAAVLMAKSRGRDDGPPEDDIDEKPSFPGDGP